MKKLKSQKKSPTDRPIVLVGMMGVGKTAVGRALAENLSRPFYDSDTEVEAAAGMLIADIFEGYGETAFRDCEARVIARLLSETPVPVIATGGGAFAQDEVRGMILEKAISIWLKAETVDIARRVRPNSRRPLLLGEEPLDVALARIAAVRAPLYAQADLTLDVGGNTIQQNAEAAVAALAGFGAGVMADWDD